MDTLWERTKRKFHEHRQHDPTGLSFIRYSMSWARSRRKRYKDAVHAGRTLEPFLQVSDDTLMVAVRLTGGIGDAIVHARILRDLAPLAPNTRFHLFTPSVKACDWIFASNPAVEKVYDELFFETAKPNYDLIVYLNSFAYYEEERANLGKIMRLAPELGAALMACRKNRRRWDVFINHHPMLDGAFAHTAVSCGKNRYNFIYSLLGLTPGPLTLDLSLDNSVADLLPSSTGGYITLNTGFDANFVVSTSTVTKCYPAELWAQVIAGIKAARPDLTIVQIGGKTSVPIDGVDVNLVAKTSLPQAAGVLSRSQLHLDIEGGLVHVAAALGVRSAVLFGPTSVRYFGYPGNLNLSSGFCGNCWWSTERWMETCPQGFGIQKCLTELSPETVVQAVLSEFTDTPGDPPATASKRVRLPLLTSTASYPGMTPLNGHSHTSPDADPTHLLRPAASPAKP
jgi:ADP-heptose:LPS heptosyltransferase